MNKIITGIVGFLVLFGLYSCNGEDSFSTSTNLQLQFSADSILLDTLFSNVPSTAKSFWVYNYSSDGIKCSNVRLERGNQTGFRVNVDGIYLSGNVGYQTSDITIRKNDSIRVYVELTSPKNYQDKPSFLEDNLVFVLESGKVQKVNLNAYSWDGIFLNNYHVKEDDTLSSSKPIIVYGGIVVDSAKTLTVLPGTTLYFHANAGLDVHGRLISAGTMEHPVTFRGDRLDNMFDYLPYDRVSGQWKGLHIYSSSYDNILSFTDLHSAFHGIVIDSADVQRKKLTINASTVHNCQGYDLLSKNANISISNSVFSNSLKDCICLDGGDVTINGCTLAQFYPFDSQRGVALQFGSENSALRFQCLNSLITGYGDDELLFNPEKGNLPLEFAINHCLIRTPEDALKNDVRFSNNIFENLKDTTIAGYKNFVLVDANLLKYQFELKEHSLAIDAGDPQTSLPNDRFGRMRDNSPDIGAFEYINK